MGEMEQALIESKNEGHEAITAVVRDLGNLGYRVKSIDYQDGFLHIGCYCPQDHEGGKSPFNWVGLSDTQDKAGKSE